VGGVVFALLAALCNAVSVIARHIASTADPHRPTGHWAAAIAACLAVVAALSMLAYFVMNAAVLAAAAAGFFVMCAGVVVMSLTAPATLQADEMPDLTRPG
jgi:uncharacterized membrane protein HdeD (DUF308 family)